MQSLCRPLSRILLFAFAAGALGGCARYQPSSQIPPAVRLSDVVPSVPEMAVAHRKGAVEWVNEGGVEIPVRVFGTNGARRPIILVHGLESHSGWFVQSAAFMAGLGHPVYVVDRRGSGLSSERRGHIESFHQWSRDLERVAQLALRRHHTNKVHVIGHCFGAIPATVFTLENPNLIASLILPTPGFFTTTDLAISQKLRALGDHLHRKSHYLPVLLKTEQFTNQEQYREFIRNDSLKLYEATTTFYWNVNDARDYVRRRREQVRCPVWVGLAGEDEIIRAEPTRELFHDFSSVQKRLIVFPEAKHILEFSPGRDAFFRELESWLRETGG